MVRVFAALVGIFFSGMLLYSFVFGAVNYVSEPPAPTAEHEFHLPPKHVAFASDGSFYVLASRSVHLVKEPRAVGRDGLKLRIATKSGELEAIAWGMADRAPLLTPDRPFDIAYRLERDWYMGEGRLVAKIVDLKC